MTTAHEIREIADRTWEIGEFDCDSMFLLEGDEKALLIDTGIGIGDLPAVIRKLTDKPVTLVLSHGHPDHVGGMGAFAEAWLSREDWFSMFRISPDVAGRKGYAAFIRNRSGLTYPYDPETDILPWPQIPHILPLVDGQVFDLGGRIVTAHACPCHTAGSMVFLDKSRRLLLAGDAVNCNLLLAGTPGTPGFVSIETALSSYRKLEEMKPQYDRMYNGHYDFRPFGEPLDPETLTNAIACCADLVAGTYEERMEPNMFPGGPDQTVIRKGRVKVVYNKDGIFD